MTNARTLLVAFTKPFLTESRSPGIRYLLRTLHGACEKESGHAVISGGEYLQELLYA